jgi:hypothetical protein
MALLTDRRERDIMTAPTLHSPPPHSDKRRRSAARAARLLGVALLALPFSGCCTRPEQPRPTTGDTRPHFEQIQANLAWKEYDDCIDYANFLIFGLLSSAHGQGYREEVREPATTSPPAATPIPLPDPSPPR